MAKLNAKRVQALTEPGTYMDGGGLRLVIRKSGGRSWVFRGTIGGKAVNFGLGPVTEVSLAQARERAAELRQRVQAGEDPRQDKVVPDAPLTLEDAARKAHAALSPGWTSEVQVSQWIRSLEMYVFPTIGGKALDSVATRDIVRVLSPIWVDKHETATRVQRRVRSVFDWAKANGHFDRDNPVTAVHYALPKVKPVVKHHAAMPWQEVPAFLEGLQGTDGVGPLCMHWVVLTAARSGEARGARWSEVDLEARTWTVPGDRMKAGKDHVVPLTDEAVQLLERAREHRRATTDLVFPSPQKGGVLSDMAMSQLLRRRDVPYTVHGFRSTFRDWAGEHGQDRDLAEMALAHAVGGVVERAYARSTLLERRRVLAAKWSEYCAGVVPGKVVSLPGRA